MDLVLSTDFHSRGKIPSPKCGSPQATVHVVVTKRNCEGGQEGRGLARSFDVRRPQAASTLRALLQRCRVIRRKCAKHVCPTQAEVQSDQEEMCPNTFVQHNTPENNMVPP